MLTQTLPIHRFEHNEANYFVLAGERPVAAASMFINGDYAQLAIAATLPEARNQGAHNLLIAVRINKAIVQGCQEISAETAEDTPENLLLLPGICKERDSHWLTTDRILSINSNSNQTEIHENTNINPTKATESRTEVRNFSGYHLSNRWRPGIFPGISSRYRTEPFRSL